MNKRQLVPVLLALWAMEAVAQKSQNSITVATDHDSNGMASAVLCCTPADLYGSRDRTCLHTWSRPTGGKSLNLSVKLLCDDLKSNAPVVSPTSEWYVFRKAQPTQGLFLISCNSERAWMVEPQPFAAAPADPKPRGVAPSVQIPAQSGHFVKEESVGIFIGVRVFTKDQQLVEVPYAVDDPVDLAYLFSFELGLIAPKRVYLLISGEAQKRETQDHLRELVRLGAQVGSASRSDIYQAVYSKSSLAGANGLLVVSFATHGFNDAGIHYLMSQDSLMGVANGVVDTGFPSPRLFEALAQSRAPRRVVLVDACRQHLVRSRGGVAPDPRSAMPSLSDVIARTRGEDVLIAARPGGYAFDDSQHRNGVFTRAVLDGLHCAAPVDGQGFVTIATLAPYVEGEVAAWVRENRGAQPGWEIGIQRVSSGRGLPLARCRGGSPVPATPP